VVAKEEEVRKGEETAAVRDREAESAVVAAAVAAKKRQEEEIAEALAKKLQEETVAGKGKVGAVQGSVSLLESTIPVQGGAEAQVKLACAGAATCKGKLTLLTRGPAKKGRSGKAETIGTSSFSISAGRTATVELKLNATGRALIVADHGRLAATLTVLKFAPAPSRAEAVGVHLQERNSHDSVKK
jgi:hypothetical protein